jgi:hypothetical protein
MSEITKEAVMEFINSNEEVQNELKSMYTVEKEVTKEVPAQINDEAVMGYLKENQSLSDRLFDTHRKKVYGKLLGKEEITEEDLKTKFVPSSQLEEWQGKYTNLEKESVIKDVLGKETFESVKDIIALDKIQKGEDGNWQGLDMLEKLKPQTPRQPNTPPASTPNIKTEEQKKQEKDEILQYKMFKGAGLKIPEHLKKYEK